jgi:aminopeptidase C
MSGVDLEEEDGKFLQYLADNSWRGEVGEQEGVDGLIVKSMHMHEVPTSEHR